MDNNHIFYIHLKCKRWENIFPNILTILFLLIIPNIIVAQNTYLLNGKNNDIGDAHIQALENGNYWTFQSLPSGSPVTGFPIIRITEFNECGPVKAVEFTHPEIYGVTRFNQSFDDGDTVRIAMRVNPRNLYSHDEVGVLSVDKNTFGYRYQYVRADNIIIPKAFIPAGPDQYFLHTFLSYTDRPPQYCSFLLDKEFNILNQYENFSEWTATGSVASTPNGYITATSENIYKLDLGLNPVWRKKLNNGHYIGNFIGQDDGVIMYVAQRPSPREIVLIKLDFNGNIIWQSGNLNFNNLKDRSFIVAENSGGNVNVVVFKFDSSNLFTDQLVVFTVDADNGNVLSAKNTFNHSLIEKFRLVDFSTNINSQNLLTLRTPDDKHFFWNILDEATCDLNVSAMTVAPSAPLELNSANMPASIQDNFTTGSYVWTRTDVAPDAELICENILPLADLLPDDTTACEEFNLFLDASDTPYDILWENGDTAKSRMITESGKYNYEINHCDINYGETITVTLEKCNCQFYLPNAISPNDDGINDIFQVYNICEYLTSFEIKIFNRWGGLVFSSQDQLFEWDGTFKGQKIDPGVYTYFLKYKSSFENEPRFLEGSIIIMR